MYSSLFLSFVCGLPVHMILTHADGVRLIQCPDLQTGVTHPLIWDTMAVVGGPPMCEQARTLGPPGTLERSLGSIFSPYNCSWEVRPFLFSLWFCVIFAVLKAHARGEHTTLVLAGSVPLRCWENRRAGLKDAGQLCSLWRKESTGRRPQQQPHLLPTDFLPDPCALESIHQVNLPPYSTWMCWKIGVITSPPPEGSPGAPGRWTWQGTDYEPYHSTDPREGHGTPLREEHGYPEKPTSAPDIWAPTFRCRHRVFQQVRSLRGSPCPSAHRTQSHRRKHMVLSKHH